MRRAHSKIERLGWRRVASCKLVLVELASGSSLFFGMHMRGCEAHDAVVLAAEGNSRLGRPKQLLTVAGETLLQRTVRMAKATGPTHLMVVLGAHAEQLAPLVT